MTSYIQLLHFCADGTIGAPAQSSSSFRMVYRICRNVHQLPETKDLPPGHLLYNIENYK
jgi:hypothetical protein